MSSKHVWHIFLKKNCPDQGEVTKSRAVTQLPGRYSLGWGNQHLSLKIITCFFLIGPKILSLALHLLIFLHSLGWFWTDPVWSPTWAGLGGYRWPNENLSSVPGKDRQVHRLLTYWTGPGSSKAQKGKVWTQCRGKRELGRAWQRVHSMQPSREPGPRTLLCWAEDSGRARCHRREQYHIYMWKCKSGHKRGGCICNAWCLFNSHSLNILRRDDDFQTSSVFFGVSDAFKD